MAAYLLDTSAIVDALNGKKRRADLFRELILGGHRLSICPVNITEVYSGMHSKDKERTEELLRSFEYRPVTWEIASLAGELRYQWARKGRPLSTPDCTIAAVALTHSLTLITDNVKDYPMRDLKLYSE
jgi:predicted nucleic acid-binding protein